MERWCLLITERSLGISIENKVFSNFYGGAYVVKKVINILGLSIVKDFSFRINRKY